MQDQLSLTYNQKREKLLRSLIPYYSTTYGDAYLIDSLEGMNEIPANSINLVITSPPYALEFKKEYGNVNKVEYVSWMLPFVKEIYRILKDDGSFVLNIGSSYNKGIPTKSIYQYKLLISIVEEIRFHLAQEFFWYNPAKLPMPAEWVSVRRIRVKDSVEHLWWFSKTPWPKANNRRVLKPYSDDMLRLNKKKIKKVQRPSGHTINGSFNKISSGGSISPNVFEENFASDFLTFGNNSANDKYISLCKKNGIKPHPARFPEYLPEFFIKFLTDENDYVLDPFAGSNTTGFVSEKYARSWIAFENNEEYLNASRFRFE